jgi:hypothetical protein
MPFLLDRQTIDVDTKQQKINKYFTKGDKINQSPPLFMMFLFHNKELHIHIIMGQKTGGGNGH